MCTVAAQYDAKEVHIGGDAHWRDGRIVQIMKEVGGRTFRAISQEFSSKKNRNNFVFSDHPPCEIHYFW